MRDIVREKERAFHHSRSSPGSLPGPERPSLLFRTIEWEFLQSQEHIYSHIVVALDVTGCGCGNWAVGDILAGLPA